MPKMVPTSLANPDDLTPYAVLKESWITDGRGHSELREPAADGEKPVVVHLHPRQAEYLIHSGQVGPIPGETKGYPADSETREALLLSEDERRAIQEQPSLGELSGELVEGQGKSTDGPVVLGNADPAEAAQQETAQDTLTGEVAALEAPDTKATRKSR